MNEAETRAELIDPALMAAGWGVVAGSRVRREVITLGRLQGGGKRGTQDIADYVLEYKGQKLAVIEAKRQDLPDTEGVDQAKRYATKLLTPYAYSTNGVGIYAVEMMTGSEGHIAAWPSPDALWAAVYAEANVWRERFGEIPFEEKGGAWQPRYYQHNAINAVLEAIATDETRILLTLATGTGKTAIAFQIVWKLFYSRWTLARDGKRRPRILFLADRNNLADQAFNAFSAFPSDALVRINPKEIREKGKVPTNGSIFFTIFQTFMSGRDAAGEPAPYFGDYPADFFDFIVIDECHRGGAEDESTWRGILEYFAPAVQLGLTATPKRDKNVDTYDYFGEPRYVYSLKDGINDGYLTPFKVRQIQTTLDEYTYTSDDEVLEGEVEVGDRFGEDDFNRVIEIVEREKKRVAILMEQIDQRQKTLVFCATQEHALAVRDLINQMKTSTDPNYCVRVTANDGAQGDLHLRTFRDNEATIPTILTTSRKLSTGVDALNVRNIVLMRPIKSMIEFKQIIGRGTRLFDGKDYFTIYDFVNAHLKFDDPDWDGEPEGAELCATCDARPCVCERPPPEPPVPCAVCGRSPCECPGVPCEECGKSPCECGPKKRIKIKLADGKERLIDHMSSTTFWSPDGKPMSAQEFIARLYGELPALFANEAQLRALWGQPDTRRKLLDGLAERGFGGEQLAEIGRMIRADHSDLYDILAYIAYAVAPISRQERVDHSRPRIVSGYGDKQQEFLDFVLSHYIAQGVRELDPDKLPQLLELKYHALADAAATLGPIPSIRALFTTFQHHLYDSTVA